MEWKAKESTAPEVSGRRPVSGQITAEDAHMKTGAMFW